MDTNTTITIGRLTMTLPGGFEERAGAIGRKTAEKISAHQPQQAMSLERLSVPVVNVNRNDSNDMIASAIARNFIETLNNHE